MGQLPDAKALGLQFVRTDVEGAAIIYAAPLTEEGEFEGVTYPAGAVMTERLADGFKAIISRDAFARYYRGRNFADAPAPSSLASSPAAPAPPAPSSPAAPAPPAPSSSSSPAPPLDQLPAAALVATAPAQDEPMLKWFQVDMSEPHHPAIRSLEKTFADVASALCVAISRSPERTVSLRKLLEARDAALRAATD